MTESAQRITFDELPDAVGSFVRGEPFVLGADDAELFERGTWVDRVHPPEEEPEFPPTLVEGFHLLGMLDAALQLSGTADPDSMWGFNYGLDKVRFVSQVHIGDRIIPEFEIAEVVAKDLGYKVLRRCTFTVEGHSRPAMTADWWTFMLPRGVLESGRRDAGDAAPEGQG